MIALLTVLTLLPLLGVLLFGRERTVIALLIGLAGIAIVLAPAVAFSGLTSGELRLAAEELPLELKAGAIAAGMAALAALTGIALWFLPRRPEQAFAERIKGSDAGVDALRIFCNWIALRVVARPGLYSLFSLAVIAGLGLTYSQLHARYRLADQVPNKQQAVAASHRLDAKLTGSNPISVLIDFGRRLALRSAIAGGLREVHSLVEKQRGVGNVWSVDTLRRWLTEKLGRTDVEALKEYVGYLPESLVRRFLSEDMRSTVVAGYVPDVDASQLRPIVDELETRLAAVQAAHPGYQISVTGLSVIAAQNSAAMIGRLNQALTIEIVFVAAFVGLAFRSPIVMLAAILPAIFPILASGVLLWLLGLGLQFASIVALTVSFGLGLSATIHFLNRLRLEDHPDRDPGIAVARATVLWARR